MIPMSECKHGWLYKIDSRNLILGVYNETQQGFVGIREKFGNEYLFTEYHWDTGAPFGTVCPQEALEQCPLSDIRETVNTIDSVTGKPVEFDKAVSDGGKGWYFVETGEASEKIRPTSVENNALFEYLENKEKNIR